MLDYLDLPFVQRGLLVVGLLAVAAGLLGTWIVLRGLAFYSHAAASAAFPGLVVADGLAFSPYLGALGTAGLAAAAVATLNRRRDEHRDSTTALVLVGALAAGVVLASDVFRSGAQVDGLLFGSLLALGDADVAAAAVVAVAAVAATLAAGPRWLATGFDPGTARGLGLRPALVDAVLLALVAAAAIALLAAVGALLAGALLVVPAATTRLVCTRMGAWQLATVALAAVEGVAGLLLSLELNAPPGATIAVLGGSVFALVAARRALRRGAAAAVVAGATLVAGCGSPGGSDDARLRVVATTTQAADLTRQVGGDAVAVTQLLRAATDPHDYEPRPDDVRALAEADLVVMSGGGLEPWSRELLDQAGGDPAEIALGDAAALRLPAENGEGYDPHWWHDPRNAIAAVAALRDALVTADPGGRAVYEGRARAFVAALRRLDRELAACYASIPRARRRLVTDHDTFAYLAQRYDLEVLGSVIPSQSTQAEPSAGALSRLAAVVERAQVPALFPESNVPSGLAQSLARETGAVVGGTLYGDTLGPPGSGAETYVTMQRRNADTIVRGLTGGRRGCP